MPSMSRLFIFVMCCLRNIVFSFFIMWCLLQINGLNLIVEKILFYKISNSYLHASLVKNNKQLISIKPNLDSK